VTLRLFAWCRPRGSGQVGWSFSSLRGDSQRRLVYQQDGTVGGVIRLSRRSASQSVCRCSPMSAACPRTQSTRARRGLLTQAVARADAATLSQAMHEQVDGPATLTTGWLNGYTPVGREYVGHHRVDHEKKNTSVMAGSRPSTVGHRPMRRALIVLAVLVACSRRCTAKPHRLSDAARRIRLLFARSRVERATASRVHTRCRSALRLARRRAMFGVLVNASLTATAGA
jgi:hypothetical protein